MPSLLVAEHKQAVHALIAPAQQLVGYGSVPVQRGRIIPGWIEVNVGVAIRVGDTGLITGAHEALQALVVAVDDAQVGKVGQLAPSVLNQVIDRQVGAVRFVADDAVGNALAQGAGHQHEGDAHGFQAFDGAQTLVGGEEEYAVHPSGYGSLHHLLLQVGPVAGAHEQQAVVPRGGGILDGIGHDAVEGICYDKIFEDNKFYSLICKNIDNFPLLSKDYQYLLDEEYYSQFQFFSK